VDYLLKPVTRARLAETLTRARERLEREDLRAEAAERIARAAEQYDEDRGSGRLERVPVKKREEILLLPVERIASIESEGELLHITTETNERHTITRALKDLEARLDPEAFLRLSRGTIARVALIESVSPMPGGTFVVTLSNGQKLSVSRQRSKVLRERLLKL